MDRDHTDQPCSFCGKLRNATKQMIEGQDKVEGQGNVRICNECVELCHDIVAPMSDDEKPDATFGGSTLR